MLGDSLSVIKDFAGSQEINQPKTEEELSVTLKKDVLNKLDKDTRKQIEKIGNRVVKSVENGERDISAAPNWIKKWRQDTILPAATAKLIEEVIEIPGYSVRIAEEEHGVGVKESRILVEQAFDITAPLNNTQSLSSLENAEKSSNNLAA